MIACSQRKDSSTGGSHADGALGWPALMAFSDGRYVGAILDRNGLRPARYCLTSDDHLYLMSEVGVNDLEVEDVIRKVAFQSKLRNSDKL
uniref:Glutamine amidotransferase type-2 domain-containing protein n=1 Tax=Ditylenchus dipsaci TaxID=166011 RepID=A0A915DB68_9BILA